MKFRMRGRTAISLNTQIVVITANWAVYSSFLFRVNYTFISLILT